MSSVAWISAIDTHDSIRFLSFSAPCLPQQAKQRNRLRWRGWSRTQSAIRLGILGSETGSFTTKWPFKYHLEMWKILSKWLNLLFFPIFLTPPYATQGVLHPLEAPNTQPPIHPSESSNPWKPSFTWPSGTRDMGMGRINWHMYVFIQNNIYICYITNQ